MRVAGGPRRRVNSRTVELLGPRLVFWPPLDRKAMEGLGRAVSWRCRRCNGLLAMEETTDAYQHAWQLVCLNCGRRVVG